MSAAMFKPDRLAFMQKIAAGHAENMDIASRARGYVLGVESRAAQAELALTGGNIGTARALLVLAKRDLDAALAALELPTL